MKRIKLTFNDQRYVARLPKIYDALIAVFQAKTIYERFDALCQLIDNCDQHLSQLTTSDEKLADLRDRALKMAMAVVDTKDILEFNEKRKKRAKYKKIDSEYMPWNTPFDREHILNAESRKDFLRRSWQDRNITRKKSLLLHYLNYIVDKADHVRYLTKEERENNRIFPSNSKLMRFRFSHPPTPLNPNPSPYTSLYLENYDTKNYAAHAHAGTALLVITLKGDMFAGSSIACKFYHSSLVNGGPVMFAGAVQVTGGHLKEVTNRSGHYRPTRNHVIQVIDFFRECGLLKSKPSVICMTLPDFAQEKIEYDIHKTEPVIAAHRLKLRS